MRSEHSGKIALGGVFSSLCLLMMFLASVLPFASFAMPMLAGAMLAVVVLENGEKTAWLVYISVSLLSAFIVPDIDAKLLFISFFGYYSILKPKIERIRGKMKQILIKLALVNTAMILGYFVSLRLFGLEETVGQSEFLGKYLPIFMLIGLNITFLMYDHLLAKYIVLYGTWFKPKFLR